MPLSSEITDALGDELWACLNQKRTMAPITERYPEMTIDDAYAVNLRLRHLRSARGDQLVGKKIGVTSHAVQSMLGVDQPDFGFLFNISQTQFVVESFLNDGKIVKVTGNLSVLTKIWNLVISWNYCWFCKGISILPFMF